MRRIFIKVIQVSLQYLIIRLSWKMLPKFKYLFQNLRISVRDRPYSTSSPGWRRSRWLRGGLSRHFFDDAMEKNVINGKHAKKKWKELFVHKHRDYVYYLCRDRIETNLEIDLLCNIFSPHFVEKWDHKSKLRCQLKRNFFSKLSVFKNIVPITTSADLTVWSDNKRFSEETELFWTKISVCLYVSFWVSLFFLKKMSMGAICCFLCPYEFILFYFCII